MPIDVGINASSINGEGFFGIRAYTILPPVMAAARLFGALRPITILMKPTPPTMVYSEGIFSVDYAVNNDPTYARPPERGGIR